MTPRIRLRRAEGVVVGGRWLRRLRDGVPGGGALVCLPHAGGTADFYRPWRELVPADLGLLAVQYPGRMERLRDAVPADLRELAAEVAGAVAAEVPGSVVLFGHSMGAAVGYETALRLVAAGTPPAALVVSGMPAPHTRPPSATHRLPDAGLWAAMRALGGAPAAAAADPEFRTLVLAAFRADLRLSETYRPDPAVPLPVPVRVLRGDGDPQVSAAGAAAWADLVTGPVTWKTLPGDHFYLVERAAEVVAATVAAARVG